jgi:hypothetical protein
MTGPERPHVPCAAGSCPHRAARRGVTGGPTSADYGGPQLLEEVGHKATADHPLSG